MPHYGTDFIRGGRVGDTGTWQKFDVAAAAAGEAFHNYQSAWGTYVYIRHDQQDETGNRYYTLYSHLDSVNSAIPREGRGTYRVEQGEIIGVAGDSGSPGLIHLHFEVHRGDARSREAVNRRLDPFDLFDHDRRAPGHRDSHYGTSAVAMPCGPGHLWTTAPPAISTESGKEPPEKKPEDAMPAAGDYIVRVDGTDTLQLRRAPGTGQAVVKEIPRGALLTLKAAANGEWTRTGDGQLWWHVQYEEAGAAITGWAQCGYLFPPEDPFNPDRFEVNRTGLYTNEIQILAAIEQCARQKQISPALLMAIVRKESAFKPPVPDDINHRRFVAGRRSQRGDSFSALYNSNNPYLGLDEYTAFGYMQLRFAAAYDAGFRSESMNAGAAALADAFLAARYYRLFDAYLPEAGKVAEGQEAAWLQGYCQWFEQWFVGKRVISRGDIEAKFFAYLDWPEAEWWKADTNLRYGADYLLSLRRFARSSTYDHPLKNILSAYNAGSPGLHNESYVNDIITYYKIYYIGMAERENIRLNSPGELRVIDSDGLITGLVGGEVVEEIPNSFYDPGTRSVNILSPREPYIYEVAGEAEGAYDLEVSTLRAGETVAFTVGAVSTAGGAVHQYSADWDKLLHGREGLQVSKDNDGDGVFEEAYLTALPAPPANPSPAEGATGIALDTTLAWSVGGPELEHQVYYEIYLAVSEVPLIIEEASPFNLGQGTYSFDPGRLEPGTTYYWKVRAVDENGVYAESPVWSFTTRSSLAEFAAAALPYFIIVVFLLVVIIIAVFIKNRARKRVHLIETAAAHKCSECGYSFVKGDRFCENCGSDLEKAL